MGEVTLGGMGQGVCSFAKWWVRSKEINYFQSYLGSGYGGLEMRRQGFGEGL